jgi:hypothetical protein
MYVFASRHRAPFIIILINLGTHVNLFFLPVVTVSVRFRGCVFFLKNSQHRYRDAGILMKNFPQLEIAASLELFGK